MKYCAFIYGAHNVVTPRRFFPIDGGIIKLDHGSVVKVDLDSAKKLEKKLLSEINQHCKIVPALLNTEGEFSIHFESNDAIEIIKNFYAISFVDEFTALEKRQEVLTSASEQTQWIKRELERVKDAA